MKKKNSMNIKIMLKTNLFKYVHLCLLQVTMLHLLLVLRLIYKFLLYLIALCFH